jgi:hypothetical protein
MFYYNNVPFLSFGVDAMSKLIGEPIKVHQTKDSMVTASIWKKRLYWIDEVIGWWREPSDLCNGTAMRLFIRVNARNSSTGTYELYKLGEERFLHRLLD